jgi:large subunit ribosomal protein L23
MQTKDYTAQDLRHLIHAIKYPVISDKATRLLEGNKYTFMVDRRVNKFLIKQVIQFIFDVDVIKINTLTQPNKKRTVGRFSGYKSRYKKAILTLKDGDSINLFPDI